MTTAKKSVKKKAAYTERHQDTQDTTFIEVKLTPAKTMTKQVETRSHTGKVVKDVMTPRVVAVTSVTFLPEVARIMKEEDVGALPVVQEDGTLIGIVTDRDIAVRAVVDGKDVSRMQVSEIYTADDLVTVSPDTALAEAEAVMADNQVRRLPIVGADSKLVGIITLADIARESMSTRANQVLKNVVQPGGEHTQVDE